MAAAPISSTSRKGGAVEVAFSVASDDEISKPSYPEGWRLWVIYVATLFAMFLVSIHARDNRQC